MVLPETELERCRAALGVTPGAPAEAIKKAYLQKSYALIRSGASEVERAALKAAHDALLAHLGAEEARQQAEQRSEGASRREESRAAQLLAEFEATEGAGEAELSSYDPRSFDSVFVNAALVPLVVAMAILVQKSPLGFLLQGFHVWVHEFGHATAAWMTGHRALPLPIGWTSIGPERSSFVYFGLLFLFAVLFVAGAREKKIVPMLAAVTLALAQFAMTWKWPEDTGYKWSIFGGVGGEFYLSAAMMGLFYFRLPEKFRWGGCRYFFLFIGAASFAASYGLWKQIKRGAEGIPYGSMINGEEDAGGDMNILHDDYHWTQRDIIHTFNGLADVCLWTLLVLFAIFALRLDKLVRRWLQPAVDA